MTQGDTWSWWCPVCELFVDGPNNPPEPEQLAPEISVTIAGVTLRQRFVTCGRHHRAGDDRTEYYAALARVTEALRGAVLDVVNK